MKGAAGALRRAGSLPCPQSLNGYATNPGGKALRALLICIGSCLSKGFPCCLPASPEAWRAAFREALGRAPDEKDRSGEEMEARENFEPRGCWWVTKQRRGSSMVRYSENSAQRWQSKHDILSFTVIWERCCFPWAWYGMTLPYLDRFLLSSPHIYFQHKEIWLKIEEEGKHTKKSSQK